MKSLLPPEVEATVDFLDELLGRTRLRNVAVRLWDGTCWPDEAPRAATLLLKDAGSLRRMFAAATEKALAEAYLRGDFDVTGEMEAAFELADTLAEEGGWKRSLRLAYLLHRLPAGAGPGEGSRRADFSGRHDRHSQERDREAVSFHYDVSNDFYRLWLDERMVYSCAYFRTPGDGLDAAQEAKLDLLCRKLRLRPGQRLLDIGCGWGGLALHAAKRYGVHVTGVTLSRNQAALATARAEAAGLAGRVQIELRDYRTVDTAQPFDAVVSVGMSEHVGGENLPAYFRTAFGLLRPGGVFLNHAIGEGPRYRPGEGPSFIDEYIFPDSDIPPVQTVVTAAAAAGFEIRDVENLREHYALTLRAWVCRLEAKHDEALAFVREPAYRAWRLYMAGSAHGFAQGRLAIYQVLLSRDDGNGQAGLPLTRDDWYS